MLLHKAQLMAGLLASTDTSRPSLGCIKIDPDGTTWASDGSIAVRITVPKVDDAEFPEVPGLPTDSVPTKKPVLIPAKVAMDVGKAIPARNNAVGLKYARLVEGGDVNWLATTDFDTPTVLSFSPDQGDFPDVAAVYKNLEEVKAVPAVAGFDINLMVKLQKFHRHFPKRMCDSMELKVRGPMLAATFEWKVDDIEVLGLLMPVRVK
jgi:hypothetical protein